MQQLNDNLKAAAKESGYPIVELTDAYLNTKIVEFMSSEDKYLDFTDDGFIVGMISDQHLLMPGVRVALELSWWVKPETRGTRLGSKLYKGFEDWAIKNQCKFIMQGKETKGCKELSKVFIREL